MFQVVNKVADKLKCPTAKIDDKITLMAETLCSKVDGQYSMKCILRDCDRCGVAMLEQKLEPLKKELDEVEWNRWEIKKLETKGKTTSSSVFTTKRGKMSDLITQILTESQTFALHLFTAEWQHQQYTNLQKNVPPKWIVTTQDFAENYRCVFADEITSAYYNYNQASLFTQFSVYHCPNPTCDKCVEESCVFITDDLKKDCYAIQTIQEQYEEYLLNKGINMLEHQVIFSDGAASQFKSKQPYYHLTTSGNFSKERSFFGSRHGKSVCDGLGGVIKQAATLHVKSRRGIIRTALELYEFSKKELTITYQCPDSHKSRVFFFVNTIKRPKKQPDLKAVPGTRAMHSVKAVEHGKVQVRRLSCFCLKCVSETECSEHCSNAAYTGEFITHDLMKNRSVSPNCR